MLYDDLVSIYRKYNPGDSELPVREQPYESLVNELFEYRELVERIIEEGRGELE